MRFELSLSTEGSPMTARSAPAAEALMADLVAEHLADGYAPPERITIGRVDDGQYIAYATMIKESDVWPASAAPVNPMMDAAADAHAGERPEAP